MSEFVFPELTFSGAPAVGRNTWLWIWNADKIPPHIGVSDNGGYFSLTYKTCEQNLSAPEKLLQANRAGTPLVLVKLNETFPVGDPQTVFSAYTSAFENRTTCLKPVLGTLQIKDDVRQLSELLKLLYKAGNIGEVFALNLTPGYKGIPAYSVDEIVKRIETLHETDGRKHKA